MRQPPPPPRPEGFPTYFEVRRKGEVEELRVFLKNAIVDKDPGRKREAIKKVIAYMTVGIDVSRLFPEMAMLSCTTDLVQKKMTYLYLVNCAENNTDTALLAVNTLQKDCRDEDPLIRGLALRSLCSLKVAELLEYLEPQIRLSLKDPNGYVRKSAVMGVLKLFYTYSDQINAEEYETAITECLADTDPQVVANAVYALEDLYRTRGGFPVTRQLVHSLMNKLSYFTEWGQAAVLNLVSKYHPEEEEEMFDLMNILEELMKHSNSAVVVSCATCFLNLTENKPHLFKQVLTRLKVPLLTLASTSAPELTFVVLSHIKVLVYSSNSVGSVLQEDFKHFYIRYADPSYLKHLKLDILCKIADETNVYSIVSEMLEYVSDPVAAIGERSVRAVGTVAIHVSMAADWIIEQLMTLVSLDVEYISTSAVVSLKDLVRKYPRHASYLHQEGMLEKCLSAVTQAEGTSAVIWMIGMCGKDVDDAPYLLEGVVEEASSNDEEEPTVRLELLTACVRLFLERPAEMQGTLGSLFELCLTQFGNPDVRDKALLYYRLLFKFPHEAKNVICYPKEITIDSFRDAEEGYMYSTLLQEFDTLSVVIGQPSYRFLKTATEAKTLVSNSKESVIEEDSSDLLQSFDSSRVSEIRLQQDAKCDPAEFQESWSSLGEGECCIRQIVNPLGSDEIESRLRKVGLRCMASGVVDSSIKLYLYTKGADPPFPFYFVEAIISVNDRTAQVTIKCEHDAQPSQLFELIWATVNK
eukprot:GHVL01039533.1.p1 GENE.GHVL01039533.1~~GHVL01039533.1.p1  ORF type:complete len:752 (-),score=116.34 GHVL01039533.1:509-2764(-)